MEWNTKAFWYKENLSELPIMTTVEELNKSKKTIIAIDKSLNKYRDKTLFPKKLSLANKQLKNELNCPLKKNHD